MSTDISIIGNFKPDAGVYLSTLAAQMALTNDKQQLVWVLPFPAGADLGGSLVFRVPSNYASTPVLVFRGIIDGTPANTFAVGVQLLERDVSVTVDAAYEAEDTASNATWTGYADEEEFELTVTLTPTSALTPGRMLYLKIYRDDSVDSTTWDFLMTDLSFRYN